jgi:hypothetical protein
VDLVPEPIDLRDDLARGDLVARALEAVVERAAPGRVPVPDAL